AQVPPCYASGFLSAPEPPRRRRRGPRRQTVGCAPPSPLLRVVVQRARRFGGGARGAVLDHGHGPARRERPGPGRDGIRDQGGCRPGGTVAFPRLPCDL